MPIIIHITIITIIQMKKNNLNRFYLEEHANV